MIAEILRGKELTNDIRSERHIVAIIRNPIERHARYATENI